MQQFRNLLKGWVGKVLLFIFILPFAFFGIEGIFNSGIKNTTSPPALRNSLNGRCQQYTPGEPRASINHRTLIPF